MAMVTMKVSRAQTQGKAFPKHQRGLEMMLQLRREGRAGRGCCNLLEQPQTKGI